MIAVCACLASDAAVFGCLVAMYFIPRERCWLEGGHVHSAPQIVSLIMLVSFCTYENQSMLVLNDTVSLFRWYSGNSWGCLDGLLPVLSCAASTFTVGYGYSHFLLFWCSTPLERPFWWFLLFLWLSWPCHGHVKCLEKCVWLWSGCMFPWLEVFVAGCLPYYVHVLWA